MLMDRRKLELFIIINAIIAILELIGIGICFAEIGWSMLIFYTQLSNIFLLIAAIVSVILGLRALKNKKQKIPNSTFELFHAATSATTVTFLTVVFVLSWMYGDLIYILTAGSMLFAHTLCPILAIVSHFMFAPKVFTKKSASCAAIFTLAYAILAVTMNILHVWHGPYPFLYIYEQPVIASIAWIIGMLTSAYGISRLLLIGKIKSK